MSPTTDALKRTFREGRHAEAVSQCEAALARQPQDRGLQRLCATMHAMTGGYARALELLRALRDPAREDGDLLFNIGNCEKELRDFTAAARTFESYTRAFPADAGGWANLAHCQFELDAFEEGGQSAAQAIRLDPAVAPELAKARIARGDDLQNAGKLEEAAADYRAALALVPGDGPTLKKATLCLLESNRGPEAIQLCRDALEADPDNLTARLGAEWLLTQLVPLWHIPMMNEPERNQAFHDGLQAVVTPEKTVFEIGTGSGILAMMAAKLGARQVVTCEAVSLVAETATRIVERNGYQDRVKVLSKPSHAVKVGPDLPAKADILLHEVFSSELLGEHVLPAIEDAKARLLKPGGQVLPSAASIMIALVGGEALGKNLHVGESFGFDLGEFNAIHPKKRPLYREDLEPELLSDAIAAFRFDFMRQSTFPAERKHIDIPVTAAGRCYGVIQWIRIELAAGIVFENHPSRRKAVSNWQHTIYGFDAPVQLQAGAVVRVRAWHDRARPWFALAGGA
jgi:tetratricopeptide (TPR) repeat protein